MTKAASTLPPYCSAEGAVSSSTSVLAQHAPRAASAKSREIWPLVTAPGSAPEPPSMILRRKAVVTVQEVDVVGATRS